MYCMCVCVCVTVQPVNVACTAAARDDATDVDVTVGDALMVHGTDVGMLLIS